MAMTIEVINQHRIKQPSGIPTSTPIPDQRLLISPISAMPAIIETIAKKTVRSLNRPLFRLKMGWYKQLRSVTTTVLDILSCQPEGLKEKQYEKGSNGISRESDLLKMVSHSTRELLVA